MLEAQLVESHLGVGPSVSQAGLHRNGTAGVVVGVLFDAEVGRHFADDVAHHRRHNLAGIVTQPARVVQNNENLNFGVIHRQHCGEAHGLVIIAVAAQLTVGTFGSTGFAADAVPCHIGVFIGVVVPGAFAVGVHAGFHHRENLFADFLRNHLAADVGLGFLYHVAVIVSDGIHHIGGDQVTAVGDSCHGRSHLHGGDRLVLAERRRIQVGIHLGHLLGIIDAGPAGFVGQVDTGGLGKAESLDIIVENGRLQRLRRLNKPEVAAVVQSTRHIQLTMRFIFCTVVGVLPHSTGINGKLTAAVEILARRHNAGVKTGGCRDQFEHRTGHIQFGDVLILPLGLTHHTLQLRVFAADRVAVFIHGGFAADFSVRDDVGHFILTQAALEPVDVVFIQGFFVEDGLHLGIVNGIGVIGVKLFDGRHAQNRAGLDVHYNSAAASMNAEGVHRFRQVLLHNGLHILVDREVQIVAVNGRVNICLPVGQHFTVDVGLGNAAPRCTGQHIVIGLFQTVGTRTVTVAEAQHRRQERPIRVAAGGSLLGGEDHNAVPLFLACRRVGAVIHRVFDDRIGHGFFHAFGHNTVFVQFAVGIGRCQNIEDAFGRGSIVEQVCYFFGGCLQLCRCGTVCLRLCRVRDDVPHRVALGQQFAVGTVDGTSGCRQLGILHLLGHSLGTVELRITQLQRIQLINQNTEEKNQENRNGDQRAAQYMGAEMRVGLIDWIGHSVSLWKISLSLIAAASLSTRGGDAVGKKARYHIHYSVTGSGFPADPGQPCVHRKAAVRHCWWTFR